jgi:MOSC domain-containing protein YiiM
MWTVGPEVKNTRERPFVQAGRIIGVCTSPTRQELKVNQGQGFLKKGFGLLGDSHGGTEKEVSLLAIESIQKICHEAGIPAGPGSFAENITTEGIDLTSLLIGSQLRVGPAVLEVIQIGKDPSQVHTYHFRGYSMLPKDGIFCKVIKGGAINVGDTIEVLEGHPKGKGGT